MVKRQGKRQPQQTDVRSPSPHILSVTKLAAQAVPWNMQPGDGFLNWVVDGLSTVHKDYGFGCRNL